MVRNGVGTHAASACTRSPPAAASRASVDLPTPPFCEISPMIAAIAGKLLAASFRFFQAPPSFFDGCAWWGPRQGRVWVETSGQADAKKVFCPDFTQNW